MRQIAMFALLCSACVPTSYTFSPTSRGVTPRDKGCEFKVLTTSPDESFEEIGTLKHYNGDMPKNEADFKKAIGARVCEVGGHAVVASRGSGGGYEAASVIKYSAGYHP
jgi:hypothetical protein